MVSLCIYSVGKYRVFRRCCCNTLCAPLDGAPGLDAHDVSHCSYKHHCCRFLAVYNQGSILAPDILPSAVETVESGRCCSTDSFDSSGFSYSVDKDFGFTSTIQLIKDLLSWKFPASTRDCDVTSVQFYFILASYVLAACQQLSWQTYSRCAHQRIIRRMR